jgi:DNA-binding NarL/FixJ family response regulator
MAGATVTVAAVDDHEAIREGVHARLDRCQGVEVVAEAATVPELLAALDRRGAAADVVLLDLMLGDGSRPGDNVRRLVDRGSRVIVYSSLAPTADLRAALAAGALGAVGKARPLSDLLEAIMSAARGEPLLTTEWAAALDAAPTEQRPGLSDRESEALQLYASGLGMKSAARRMGITLATYKEYLLRVRRKYAHVDRPAGTKLALYHRAVEDGYLTADHPGPDHVGGDHPAGPDGTVAR